MKKILIALLVVTGFLQISCSSDTVNNSPTTNPVDVYVAGSKNGQACYWKNNQLVTLDNQGLINEYGNKIKVFNNDVYVLGVSSYGNNSIFWKNGVMHKLKEELSDVNIVVRDINDFYVDGSDVYFVGKALINGLLKTAYWKNNVVTILSSQHFNNNEISNTKIFVHNQNVYVIGQDTPIKTGYYINSIFYESTDISGFTNNNNDVYLYGSDENSLPFYKNLNNGTKTTLTTDNNIYYMAFENNLLSYSTMNYVSVNNNLSIIPKTGVDFIDITFCNNNVYTVSNTGTMYYIDINGTNVLTTEFFPAPNNSYFRSIYVVQN